MLHFLRRAGVPAFPILLNETFYMRAHSTKKQYQIVHGDQTILEEKFLRVDRATRREQKFLVTRTLTLELFAV